MVGLKIHSKFKFNSNYESLWNWNFIITRFDKSENCCILSCSNFIWSCWSSYGWIQDLTWRRTCQSCHALHWNMPIMPWFVLKLSLCRWSQWVILFIGQSLCLCLILFVRCKDLRRKVSHDTVYAQLLCVWAFVCLFVSIVCLCVCVFVF